MLRLRVWMCWKALFWSKPLPSRKPRLWHLLHRASRKWKSRRSSLRRPKRKPRLSLQANLRPQPSPRLSRFSTAAALKKPAKKPKKRPPKKAERKPAPAGGGNLILQRGSFGDQQSADAQRAKLAMMGVSSSVVQATVNGKTVYRVQSGRLSRAEAERTRQTLKQNGVDSLTRNAN